LQAYEVSAEQKLSLLRRLLENETGRCLVFTRTKRGTERLAKKLVHEGISAAMIHGGRTQPQRNAALADFQKGKVRLLIATDVASRGIHVDDIAHVINYELPGDRGRFRPSRRPHRPRWRKWSRLHILQPARDARPRRYGTHVEDQDGTHDR